MSKPTFAETFNLVDYFLFDRLSEGKGERIAIRFGERSYRYDDVAAKSLAFMNALFAAGVRRGERVLIILHDVPPFAWAIMGTFARGAVVAMGNPDAPIENLRYLVEYTRATAVVTHPGIAEALMQGVRTGAMVNELQRIFVVPDVATGDDAEGAVNVVDDLLVVPLTRALGEAAEHSRPVVHRDEPAMWLFTSGSTGEPKANIHSHRDFAFNTEVYAKATVGYREGDVSVSVPRLFFGYATGTNLFFPFAVGGTSCLFSERPTPESVARAVEAYQPTVVTNVPTMIGKLLDHDEALRAQGKKGIDWSSVRFSLSAGEALPEALLQRWQARVASDVYDGIGSAEMFHIYASNRPGDVRPGSLGKVVDGYELRVLPESADGPGATPCAAGEIGVLWVKGDSVSHGYWLDRDRSWKTFHGHWCRTGDLFHVDEGGYLYFAGRADDLLKVGGQWVAPLEVEACLMRHESVASVAVIGVEQEGLLKTKAYVVLRPGFVASDAIAHQLSDWARARLAKYKYPRMIEFVVDLPKNDRGKVDKKALRSREPAT
jgi:benzoate-CoA ligase family protein